MAGMVTVWNLFFIKIPCRNRVQVLVCSGKFRVPFLLPVSVLGEGLLPGDNGSGATPRADKIGSHFIMRLLVTRMVRHDLPDK